MREKIAVNRRFPGEPFLTGVILTVFLYYCYAPILAANIDNAKEDDPRASTMSAAREDALPAADEWRTVQSTYFNIYYCDDADLKAMARRLSKRRFYTNSDSGDSALTKPEEKVAYRIDVLFSKVREMLDMHPLNMKGVKIKIFRDRAELNDEYYKIFKQRADLKSYYIHKYNTIYTCETDISDSVIAHELGHAVVDHYFLVLPPERIREMLAMYVDVHLE